MNRKPYIIPSNTNNKNMERYLHKKLSEIGEGGGGGGSDPEAIKYTEQTLTAEQQAQARTNIGAADASSLNGKKLWTGSAAEYALLTPSSDTIYFITP